MTAFTDAASAGNIDALVAMLAEDAVMVTDGGAEGRRVAGIRNLQAPLTGAARIAAFIVATARSVDLEAEVRIFFHADLGRLRYLGPRTARPGMGGA